MDFTQFHETLRILYADMMPKVEDMAAVAKGIAGLGALFFVAYRVWQSLSKAEPIDIFPLLRPFCIGLCIMFFPVIVLDSINAVMTPLVQGTHKMLEAETFDMKEFARQKDELEFGMLNRRSEAAYMEESDVFNAQLQALGITDIVGKLGMYAERLEYKFRKAVRNVFQEFLELVFQAAALVIDVLRTFFLIVLSILGPIAFAISVWDGFGSTLTQWITRYISVYLWLPVSDLFSTVLARLQSLMLQSDIERMRIDPNFSLDNSDVIFLLFLIIGIVGYFTIPSVAGWIISAGGMGNFGKNVNQAATKTGAITGGAAGATAGNIMGRLKRKKK